MFEDALNYPREGDDWLTTVLVGGGLEWAAILIALVSLPLMIFAIGFLTIWLAVVPALLIAGYLVAVARGVLAGEPEPPAFEEWQRYFVDGLKLVLVGIVYAVPYVVLVVVLAVVVALGGRAGALLGVLLAGVGFVYAIAIAYLFPVSLVNMAREGDVTAAFDFAAFGEVALNGDYLVSWILAVAVNVLGSIVVSVLTFVLIGVLVGPFIQFYTRVSAVYLLTRGYMDARDLDFDPGEPAGDRQSTLDEAGDRSNGLSYGENGEDGDEESVPSATERVETDSDVDSSVESLHDIERRREREREAAEDADAESETTGAESDTDAENVESDAESESDAGSESDSGEGRSDRSS